METHQGRAQELSTPEASSEQRFYNLWRHDVLVGVHTLVYYKAGWLDT